MLALPFSSHNKHCIPYNLTQKNPNSILIYEILIKKNGRYKYSLPTITMVKNQKYVLTQ